jgi:hypothetical protein
VAELARVKVTRGSRVLVLAKGKSKEELAKISPFLIAVKRLLKRGLGLISFIFLDL